MPRTARRGRLARLTLVAVAAVLAVGATSCSKTSNGDNSSQDTSTNVNGGATSIVRTSTTTAPPASTTTTVPPKPVGRPEAKDAALTLYGAWKANDRATASQVADPAAVDAVFAAGPGNYELYKGCDTGEFDTGGCLFRNRSNNDTIQIDVEKRDGQWVVAGAFFSPGG